MIQANREPTLVTFDAWCAAQRRRIDYSLRQVEPRIRRTLWAEDIVLQRDKPYLEMDCRGSARIHPTP